MHILRFIPAFVASSIVLGCASNPNKIEAAYVSPLKYQKFDCDQIAIEQASVERRTNTLYHSLKKESNKDNAQMGIGLVLFWPALFFLEGGDGPQAAEYGQLKGDYAALRDTSVAKKCDLAFQTKFSDVVTEEPPVESEEEAASEETDGVEESPGADGIEEEKVTSDDQRESVKPNSESGLSEELRSLKKLLDDGLISQEEYDTEKKDILAKY